MKIAIDLGHGVGTDSICGEQSWSKLLGLS